MSQVKVKRNTNSSFKSVALFLRNERGAATVLVVIMFTLMIAFSGMIIDIGRIMNIHSQASSYADRVALAAAAELDGEGGAMARAVRAGIGDATDGPLVPQGFRFSLSGDNDVDISSMIFMSAIGDDDADPYARSPLAGDQPVCNWTPGGGFDCDPYGFTEAQANALAAFVLVTTTTETENFVMFPIASFLVPGIATEESVAPQALAGFNRAVCNIVPMFMCNPAERDDNIGAPFDLDPGTQVLGVTGDQYAPGNFGFVASVDGTGANIWQESVANIDPNTQCIAGRLTSEPGGMVGPVQTGLNVRFDMFDGNMGSGAPGAPIGNPQYAPAANVAKGLQATGGCASRQSNLSPDTIPLPRDQCFIDGTNCLEQGLDDGDPRRFGMKDWDRAGYWATNHPTFDTTLLPAGWDEWSRYRTYRHEIENVDPGLVDSTETSESGDPTCSSQPTNTNVNADRRVLIVAVSNCREHEGELNGRGTIPTLTFAKVFLTEPVGITAYADLYTHANATPSDNQNIFYEVIGEIEPGADDGILHEFPVLFR